jgi:hypothetical protein
MKIDGLDFEILSYLLFTDGEPKTVCDVVVDTLNPKDKYDLIKQTNKLEYRFKKLLKEKLLTCEVRDKKRYYSINVENMLYGDGILSIGNDIIDIGDCLILQLKDKSYYVVFLGDENDV